jgi:hypothetical protein
VSTPLAVDITTCEEHDQWRERPTSLARVRGRLLAPPYAMERYSSVVPAYAHQGVVLPERAGPPNHKSFVRAASFQDWANGFAYALHFRGRGFTIPVDTVANSAVALAQPQV